jgi:hypothetical protein
MTYEINVEKIQDQLYVKIDDMVKLCEGSIKGNGDAFDQALAALIKQFYELKVEASRDLESH